MSWVAVGAISMGSLVGRMPVHYFGACKYCGKQPEHMQQEANCKSCGAALPQRKDHQNDTKRNH